MIYRTEHPNPQFEREQWINLNGEWQFAFDFGDSGRDRKMYLPDDSTKKLYDMTINVPFCPESRLSGIEYKDFINAVWYRREVFLESGQLCGHVLLHFGAADYECHVYVNGTETGKHIGGYSSFSFDITSLLNEGKNVIIVYVSDNTRSGVQPRGKQSGCYFSQGCDYTRTTGIWQTVWMEFMPEHYIKKVKFIPDIEGKCFHVECNATGTGVLTVTAFYEGKQCGSAVKRICGDGEHLTLPLDELYLWECGNGRLYDILLEYKGDNFCDRIKSYAGMRQVRTEGFKFLLNGKCIFQRTVLDQGYYRDGIYTAPTDGDLLRDIKISKAMGFNGARLHQKIFEPRFLYHCDREGYIVWGEHGNWGLDLSEPSAFLNFMPEWLEAVERDFNHPSIIGWCPFNETWDYDGRKQNNLILENIYRLTKALDPTRPCIDTSGHFHVITDIYDLHNYRQNVGEFSDCYKDFSENGTFTEEHPERQRYEKGLPLFISEYGGIKWDISHENDAAWGYGEAPKTETEFIERYRGLTECLLNNPYIMGFCYTQLYDIEQETNGLYDYDRNPKFDTHVFFDINSQRAAIEDEC